jgi:hypothetical protein
VNNPLGNESSLIESALSKPSGVQRDGHYRTRLSAPIQSNAASNLLNAGVINLHYASELLTEPRADV